MRLNGCLIYGNIPHQIQICSLLKLKFCQTSEAENKLYLALITKPGQVEKEEVEEKKAVGENT